MDLVVPNDLRAEVIFNYFGDARKDISFIGNHGRNAYEDIFMVSQDEETIKMDFCKQGLYDILPETLFHPIDRFNNIPSNEYKERFAEEVEHQRIEETNARTFFSFYDKFILSLSSAVTEIKQNIYADNRVLSDIICDSLSNELKENRFIKRAKEFTPRCKSIRGDDTMITLMLRKIMTEEGLRLIPQYGIQTIQESNPKYSCVILQDDDDPADVYLGNTFDEDVLSYEVQYWNDDCCDEFFMEFVNDIKVFENFLNDYFMGMETLIHFHISVHALPVRLSDEMCCNFLDYNTNL